MRYFMLPGYPDSETDADDMAAIKLAANCAQLGSSTGTGSLGFVGGADWTDDVIYLNGYPGSLSFGGDLMFRSQGTIVKTNPSTSATTPTPVRARAGPPSTATTTPPGSGTPLGYYVTGVHTSGNFAHTRNYASRITRARFATLNNWIAG